MRKIKQQFTTDGFAIWITGEEEKYSFDVHINEWLTPKKESYIDFGLRLFNTSKIANCFIYVPYFLSLDEIADLASKLNDEKISRGIFNANCCIKTSSVSPIIEIGYNGRKENVITLSAVSVTVSAVGTGSLIEISIADIVPSLIHEESYLRFRLPHKTLDSFFKMKKHSYKFQFESPVITERYNFVIKLNEVRSLPFEIRKIFPESKQNVQKVITSLSANEKYIVDDSACYKIRHLEVDLYENYVPEIFSCSETITYQWLMTNPKSHYNFNIKIDYSCIMWKSFLLYSFLFIIFSFLGNFLWELFKLIPCFRWIN